MLCTMHPLLSTITLQIGPKSERQQTGGLSQKVGGQFKNSICDKMLWAISSVLLNLNYKFDKISGDIHV